MVEILDATTELAAERRGVERTDGSRSALSLQNVLPGLRHRVTHGGNHAEPCNHYPPARHRHVLIVNFVWPNKAKAALFAQ